MNILFLGGTGNISTDCTKLLHQQGHQITVLTRGHNPVPQQYQPLVADRHDPKQLKKALEGKSFDVVADFTTYNTSQAQIAFDALNGKCKQYIFVSTVCVYQKPEPKLPITENTPRGNQFSQYGRDKEKTEDFFLDKMSSDNFPLTIVRPAHTYGETWIPNPVASSGFTLAWRLLNKLPIFLHDDGQSLWTLTHTTDFAVGFAGLVGNKNALGEAFQITSDVILTWNQIIREIQLALDAPEPQIEYISTEEICRRDPSMEPKLKGDKANHGIFDCSKIKRIVPEFQCNVSFRQGIRQSVQWFKDHPEKMVPDKNVNAIYEKVLNAK
ncbi:MAG: NAD-dependent epimerase/dehydratase family protein [Lentisphaerae bacterium]|jgi:nucleoside-diphosphate-sugar epimerase|nr:NAD-dependent epimerase/dehydratase family protein [Lentisphaerota bacterium]